MAELLNDKLALCDAGGICSFLRQAARFVTANRDCIKYVTPEELPEPAAVMMTLFVLLAHQQKKNYVYNIYVYFLHYVHRSHLICT